MEIKPNGWTYKQVTIAELKPGATFYRENPLETDHNTLPDYNTPDCTDHNTLVWVMYPSWQKFPYTK